MSDAERAPGQVLGAGGLTHVVRIGDTVRRPVRPFTATVHAYLRHVRDRGFLEAPEPLGVDEEGREVLSFLDGDVPLEPLPEWALAPEVLDALGRLVRRLHDAARDFAAPPDAEWGGIPGTPPPGVVPLFDRPELVSHQDYCPGNVVFRGGLPAALIDFDLARPTTRIADAVNALSWWVPLVAPEDRPPGLGDADPAERIRVFADAYGMDAGQRLQAVDVAVRRAANTALTMRAAAEVDPVFRRWWDEGIGERTPRAALWLAREADLLRERLAR